MAFKQNPNFENEFFESIYQRSREIVETTYCIKHNKFASLIINNQDKTKMQIIGCCDELVQKATRALRNAK